MANHYETLGITPESTESEIKKAYRTLSMKYHPDRDGGDKEKFQEISSAYETLSDENKRRQYDHEMHGMSEEGMHFGNMNEFHDMGNIFNMMFGGGNPHGMPGMPPGMHHMFSGGMGPEIKVFHNGVQTNGFFQNLLKPQPIIKNIKISLEQAYLGVSLPVEIEKWIVNEDNSRYNEKETVYINIHQGIDDSEIIILRDRGHVVNNNVRGDIKLIVQVENSTPFTRQGLDIIYKKNVTLKEALCGFVFEVTHLNGKLLCFNNNNNNRTIIKPNYRKIIPQMGMIRDNSTGNLLIDFNIEFPESLTEEQIKILSEHL